jgi:glycosyltransferase involved in cell wall biosynthesis
VHTLAVVIPALDAAPTIVAVVRGAQRFSPRVIVVDDGSRDATSALAETAGAYVVAHPRNLGKGAALRSGLLAAQSFGARAAVTLDADGQHPPHEIEKLLAASSDPRALVLGVRNLVAAGAPSKNQWSNGFANWFLSHATGHKLADTQCGMRRYPIAETLALGVREDGFGFETEVLLRAIRVGLPIVEAPLAVLYPADRTTHFDAARDPWRIVGRVLLTMAESITPR